MNFKEWFILESGRRPFVKADELQKRLGLIGWSDGHRNGSHLMIYAPKTAPPVVGTGSSGTGFGMTTIPLNQSNWQQNYGVYASNITRQYPDLDEFLYETPFKIPHNFDVTTQSFKKDEEISPIINVLDLYRYLTSRWEHPEEALAGKTINGKLVLMGSFDSGKLELIYQNNETEEVDFHKNVQIQPSQFGFLQSAA